jgi:hypothetical protein
LSDTLAKFLPDHAIKPAFELIVTHGVHLKIVNERELRAMAIIERA